VPDEHAYDADDERNHNSTNHNADVVNGTQFGLGGAAYA
jgi:hypothetical protein